MAYYPSWLGLLANPYRLGTILLCITACLFTLTTLPPSSVAYLIRVDSTNNEDAGAFTTWLGSRGYCTSDINTDDASSLTHSSVHCSGVTLGYDVTTALAQDGTTKVNVPEALVMSMFLTRPPVILHPIAIALSLIGMAAYQVILCRPRAILYVFSMGGSLLAFLISGVSLVMEASLEAYIKSGFPAKNTTFTTTLGPVAYAIKLAFVFQLAACVVGFYTCIGGKHHCEESIRLDEEDLIVYHGAPQDFAEYARQTEKKHDYSIIEVMEKRETPADVTMEKR